MLKGAREIDLNEVSVISVISFLDTYQSLKMQDYGMLYLDHYKLLGSLLGSDEQYPETRHAIETVSRRTRENWKSGKVKPKSVHATEQLERIGFTFPIRYTDRNFPDLLRLYASVLFSGRIDSRFFPRIFPSERITEKELIEKFPSFNLSYKTQKNIKTIEINECGCSIGRILFLMGIPRFEGKNTTSLRIPKVIYLKGLLENRQLNSEHSHLAYSLLYTFVEELIRYKVVRHKSRVLNLNLFGNRSERYAKESADLIRDLLNFLFPFNINYKIEESIKHGTKLYTPIFPLYKRILTGLRSKYGF